MEDDKILNDIKKTFNKDIKYIETDIITKELKENKSDKEDEKYNYIKFSKALNAVAIINMTKAQYKKYWENKYKEYPNELKIILKTIEDKFKNGLTPLELMIKLIQNSNDYQCEKEKAINTLRKEDKSMKEKCFIVKKENHIYKEYFDWWNNYKNLGSKWKEFKELVGIETTTFVLDTNLFIVPTKNDINNFGKMFCEKIYQEGLRKFKTDSKIQKDWEEFVKNNNIRTTKPNFIFDFIGDSINGNIQSKLFHYNDIVYASIKGEFYSNSKIPEGYEEIKKSEFYKIIEKIMEEKNG